YSLFILLPASQRAGAAVLQEAGKRAEGVLRERQEGTEEVGKAEHDRCNGEHAEKSGRASADLHGSSIAGDRLVEVHHLQDTDIVIEGDHRVEAADDCKPDVLAPSFQQRAEEEELADEAAGRWKPDKRDHEDAEEHTDNRHTGSEATEV